MMALDAAAWRELRRHAADEALAVLCCQPDRAIFLAGRAGIVMKVYADAALLRREWEMTQLAHSVGVPTSALLGFTGGPPAVMVSRRVVGDAISGGDPRAASEAGRLLARFHRLNASPPFSTGEARWNEHILTWAERELAATEQIGALNREQVAALRAHFAAQRERFATRPIALLHGDLQSDHILVAPEGGRIAAFLDFADAQPGDPLLDLAVLTLWDDTLAEPLLRGYGDGADDSESRMLLHSYRLLRHISEVPWLLDRGFTDHAARNIAAIERMLGEGLAIEC